MGQPAKRRFATPKEVAEVLEVHERTVRRWCTRGDVVAELLPSGAQWRIRVDENGEPLRP